MKARISLFFVLLTISLFLFFATAHAADGVNEDASFKEEVVILLDNHILAEDIGVDTVTVGAFEELQELPVITALVTADEQKELAENPGIVAVMPNIDFDLMLQDSIPLIHADRVHALAVNSTQGITGDGAGVCVIDTGIDAAHPVFANRIAAQYCACDDDSDNDDVKNYITATTQDNCRYAPNPDQQNGDGDWLGDACGTAIDGDGRRNGM